jgi:hypothetical protein
MPLHSAVVPRCRMFFALSLNQDYAARASDGRLWRVELPTPAVGMSRRQPAHLRGAAIDQVRERDVLKRNAERSVPSSRRGRMTY